MHLVTVSRPASILEKATELGLPHLANSGNAEELKRTSCAFLKQMLAYTELKWIVHQN